jgi:hypothetical protein
MEILLNFFDSDNYSTAPYPDEKTMYFVSDMPGTIGLSV